MTDPTPLAPRQIAALLDASRKALVAEMLALGGHAGERLIPDGWCANEVLGHLVEAEKRGFGGRIRAMIAEDAPALVTWVPPAVAAARHDDERDPESLVNEFLAIRDDSLVLVRSITAAQLVRTGIHPQVGPVTVQEILHEWVHHDRNHLSQMTALTQALVWQAMGNARRFSDPDV